MRLCDPNSIGVTCEALTQEACLCLKKGEANVHIAARVDSCNLLKITPKESVSTPSKRLEGNFFTLKISLSVQEAASAISCQVPQLRKRLCVLPKQDPLKISETYCW